MADSRSRSVSLGLGLGLGLGLNIHAQVAGERLPKLPTYPRLLEGCRWAGTSTQ